LVNCVKAEIHDLRRTKNLSVEMFSSEYPPCWGGVGRHVQNLCKQLQEHVDLHLITATYGQPNERFEVTNLARIRVKSFPILLTQYLFAVNLRKFNGSDITHVHVPHSFLPRTRSKIVSTFHVVWAQYSRALEREHPISMFDLQLRGLNRRLIRDEGKLARRSNAIIAVSTNVKEELLSQYDVPPDRVHVIHNGVEIRTKRQNPVKDKFILYVGRQTAHKGIPYLFRAFEKFARNHSEFRLVIVGERLEGGVDPSLVKLSESLGLSKLVDFKGRLTDREVWRMMSEATCLVLPSLAESFGLAILEAMAGGTPVIATNVGGIPDLVKDHRNGLLVPPADPDTLAESIQSVVSNPRMARKLADEGRRTAMRFTWERMAEKTLKVYERACE
jgi:starch synthase